MPKTQKITRRELVLAGAAATGAALVSAWGVRDIMERRPTGSADNDGLARVCWQRWRGNGRYKPTLDEVRCWLRIIISSDQLLLGPLFYMALIDLESLGDPTLYQPSDGRTYGLGCVSYAAAVQMARTHKLPVKHLGSALFNPLFNIQVMVKLMEGLVQRSPIQKPLLWALFAYNAGETAARKAVKRFGTCPDSYYLRHQERMKEIQAALLQGEAR